MLRIIPFTLGLFFIVLGCGQERISDAEAMGLEPTFEQESAPITTNKKELTATTFNEMPASITDCACQLRLLSEDAPEGYFFAFNREEGSGVISINNELQSVIRGASLTPANAQYDSYFHENQDYRIQTSLNRQNAPTAASGEYAGKVTVTGKESGEKLSFIVAGNCSC